MPDFQSVRAISFSSKPNGRGRGFTLVELLVVISIIGILVALLLPAVQSARESARKTICLSHLKNVGLAALQYESQYRRFPPGARLHEKKNRTGISWRVLLLPYIEENPLYDQTDLNREGGANNWIGRTSQIDMYTCPSVDSPAPNGAIMFGSIYSGIAGAGRDGGRLDLEDFICGDVAIDGVLYPESKTSMQQIEDGTSHTFLLGERAYVFRDWMSGATKFGSPPTEICSGAFKNIIYPINANAQEFGYYKFDFSAPPVDRKILLNDLHFGSLHPGGAHFAFADGSVSFMADDLDFTVFQDLSTRAGGEVISQ